MASANAEKQRPHRHPWRKSAQRLSGRLFCCSCLRGEEKDPLQEQEMKINGGPQHPRLDQRGSGEKEAIQITVEDLGIVNTGFSLLDEDPLTPRNSMARSASSVSACPRALKKRRLKPLSSLPIRPQAEPAIASTSREDDEEEEEDPLLYESGTDSTLASGSLLTPPVINLIPPTPSDVVDDDQFFDINSEESVAHTSGSDGSFAAGDQESYEEETESVEAKESKEGPALAENGLGADGAAEPEKGLSDQFGEEREVVENKEEDKEETKPRFLRSAYQVAPLPENPQRRSFSTGINLLSFTEHNLDDLSNRDVSCSDMLKAELRRLPHAANMDTFSHQRRPITRSCSLGDTPTRSTTFHALTHAADQHQEEEGSPQQRRITVASYMPQSKDQNGNFPEKDVNRQVAKSLRELNTAEVCQWFTNIGLQKCLPFIREAKLCGTDIASVDVNTLDILHITTPEEREQLLSAIYNELHPPSTITQRLDSLLESIGPNNVETFTETLVSMSKSKSAPHVSCLSMSRRSLKLRNNSQNYMVQRNSQLIEITINASERIVHLRTPKETTVGKIMDSCIKMLGVTEDKSLFTLKEKQGSSEDLSPDQQIGSLLTSTSDNRQLELHLCKTEKPTTIASENSPEADSSNENGDVKKNVQGNQAAKEERIRELNQQVDSLQNAIFQIQELHHGLVAFCSELKNMDGDVNVNRLGSAELKQRLELVKSRLNDKRQSLQTLRDNINNSTAHKKKQLEVRLLEKMTLNCQVFKEEISMVHLNRQVAHLQNALQESKDKARKKSLAIGSLSQLVSPRSPAMLLVVQENQGPDGHYGFTCHYKEGSGLVVVEVDNTHLCIDDRLVEVNGVPVVNSTQEELTDLLMQEPSAQIVVLRQPPPTLTAQQHPPPLQHTVSPDPMQTICPKRDAVTMETPPRRKVMAI
ncbi:uncharacterized protein LOC121189923 [Toxotes jaculatrix]|uniref:uncharacterized protein LOC121189923 n=1 Tax=Toxotes jaculatrix TaxID=941984 RepID=UPI001B3B0584|nr:uncharacterized protein LOC121189923 [Toxotes jaculatrix]